MNHIGITTTLPVECLLAAGRQPVDLNNLFVSHPDPARLVSRAEKDGFPLNTCTWIKGIYGACLESGINTVICVTGGDCSNALMLTEVLKLKGVRTIDFSYPDRPVEPEMQQALDTLAGELDIDLGKAEKVREEIRPLRDMAGELDRLSWQENLVSGFENHFWLVSASDFNRDTAAYQRGIKEVMTAARKRRPSTGRELRLAYIGVPPVFARTLYGFIEDNGARVVFNELQRQFAMPEPGSSLARQYCNYTYPYPISARLADILSQLRLRRIDGIIHYVQSFCYRAIGDIVFKSMIDLPILTIEGGSDFELNQHLKTRIEAFLDMLEQQKLKNQGGF